MTIDEDSYGGYGGYGGSSNGPPVAVDDNVSNVSPTVPVYIHARDNDSDPDSDPLTIVSISSPSHGSAQISSGGDHIIYTPDVDFTSDSFTYTIDDGQGNTATATISLDDSSGGGGSNTLPELMDDSIYAVADGIPIVIDVLANDSDEDEDTLTITAVSSPAFGTAVIDPGGQITYTPGTPFADDSFTYTVDDGSGSAVTATVYLDDDPYGAAPPEAVDDHIGGVTPGIPLNILVLENDEDDDHESLEITAATAPQAGSVQLRDGYITYVPDVDFESDSFTYTIEDSAGGSSTATVYLELDDSEEGYGGYAG